MLGFCLGVTSVVRRRHRSVRITCCAIRCDLYDLLPQVVPYDLALAFQRELRDAKLANASNADSLILLQHPPTYTLGTGSTMSHILFNPVDPPEGSTLFRTERGGEVTFHAPGQACFIEKDPYILDAQSLRP